MPVCAIVSLQPRNYMNLLQDISDKVEETYSFLESKLGRKFPRPALELKKIGRTAGRAHYRENKIVINPAFAESNREELIHLTTPHEIAHLASFLFFGRDCKHGPDWRYVMRLLGLPPNRCHNYDIENVVSFEWFHCDCRNFQFSTRRANNCKRGVRYRCKDCKQTIVPGQLPTEFEKPSEFDLSDWM